MKLGKMSSIGQYRNVIKPLISAAQFKGLDNEGNPIYDSLISKPIIEFTGTVKLHGTNGSVGMDSSGNLWAQSKESVITPLKDNAGFAQFIESNKKLFYQILKQITLDANQVLYLYGEWAGKGIQKNTAIAELDKAFYVFSAKIQTLDEAGEVVKTVYLPNDEFTNLIKNDPENRIFNLYLFKTFKITVDCSVPHEAQNKIVELVEDVERQCPVAKEFGVTGIGEGIVFIGEYKGERYSFKAKGEKHAAKCKVKKLNRVDDEKINLINETAEKVTPAWRLDQLFNDVVGDDINRSKLGDYIRAVMADIVKEELDVLTEAGLTVKDIGRAVSEQAKDYFFVREKESLE